MDGHRPSPATHGQALGCVELPGLAITDSRHEPNTRLSWHRHDFAGFLFVLEGAYQEQFGREEFWSKGRSILYKPAATRHANRFGPASFRSFIVEILDQDLFQASVLPDAPRHFAEGPLSGVGARIYAEYRAPDPASPLIIDGLVRTLVGLAARTAAAAERSPPAWLLRARERMDDAPMEIGSVQELAREAAIHPDHFTRTFRRHFGMLPGEYLRDRRLTRVCALLSENKLPLSDVALACGFSDQSHMTRCFRRCFGVTPDAYRKQRR